VLSDLESILSGVRSQAVMADGSMVHDFLIRPSRGSLHVQLRVPDTRPSALFK
jgi:L-2-hydroxyglutarate oxidase